MRLRRDDTCSTCGLALTTGTVALWSASQRVVSCVVHPETPATDSMDMGQGTAEEDSKTPDEPLNGGIAGGSARAENMRRVKNRHDRVTERFPRAGKYILALTDEPQSTRAWETGAVGEIAIGRLLDALSTKYEFQVLHDRLIPKSRANIDHIAITRFGVFVIDAKNYQGVVRIEDRSGFFEKSAPELFVGRRNCMKLVSGVKKQVAIVEEILRREAINLPVQGVLAFYAADWGTFKFLRGQREIDGVLLNSKGLDAIVSREGTHQSEELKVVWRLLAKVLVSAT